MCNIIIVYNSCIPRLLQLDGLVLYPFVLLSAAPDEITPSILKHELTHVRQIERDGFCKFYLRYCVYMCIGTYANNPYEVEAFSNENISLTDSEVTLLGLPAAFPKTDFAMSVRGRQCQ